MTFQEATTKKELIQSHLDILSDKLKSYPRGDMGLVPDHVKFSDDYRQVKQEFDKVFQELRDFNRWYVKAFKAELREKRKNRFKSV